jgi:hypothetical protein
VAFHERWSQEQRLAGVEADDPYWVLPPQSITGVWPAALGQLRDAAETDVRTLIERSGQPLDPDLDERPIAEQENLQIVALWWWMLPALGVPWPVGALACLALIGLGARVLWREARPQAAAGSRSEAPEPPEPLR